MIVSDLKVSDWNKDGTIVKVTNVQLDDGRDVAGYDLPPGLEVGKPLPDGWEVATAKSGKPYIKPLKSGGKKGGFEAAFRNTAAGQAVEQERMDRRTALMQAVALGDQAWDQTALQMYSWLRATAGTAGIDRPSAPVKVTGEKTPSNERDLGAGADKGGAGVVGREAVGPCLHSDPSPLKLDGTALPNGFLRCVLCGQVSDKQGVFKE